MNDVNIIILKCVNIPPLHFKVFYLQYCTVHMATHFVHPTLPPT